jgi:hypothetical protein
MARLSRVYQKIFGSSAPSGKISQFGSLAAGSPVTTTNPATVQGISEFLQGWTSAVVGPAAPAIEDMNALFYLAFYQFAYLFQAGVAEWDASTTYYIGSIVNDGTGALYISLQDNNLNNAVSNGAFWKSALGGNAILSNGLTSVKTSNYTIQVSDGGKCILLNSAAASFNLTLITPTAGFSFSVKDTTGSLSTFPVTIVRNTANKIENLTSDYVLGADYGFWTFFFDGTNWFIA